MDFKGSKIHERQRNGVFMFFMWGGSTMGYKLAGFDVVGCNEIDKRMMYCYIENHHPKYSYLEDIRDFVKRESYPEELYNLDILDGSPPCSSFSIAGSREEGWGKEKKFREGQKEQVLDTLFFDFIKLAKKLQPKVVVAENVKGLLLGNAIEYVRRIYESFDDAGFYCQHFLLNASTMGVPQRRERVFFICIRKDLAAPFIYQYDMFTVRPKLEMVFKCDEIPYKEFADYKGESFGKKMTELFNSRQNGDIAMSEEYKRQTGKRGFFNQQYLYEDNVSYTLTAHKDSIIPFNKPVYLSKDEVCKIATFPLDYNFNNNSFHYICGMSVPPVMMAQIASNIYDQWLSKIN